ncbi:EAL domain-containing protein, partial [Ectothiorhodospira lacustris]|uniref:EAL domain-containing protein n=1 Tax=Ectothiorhodospira lacustris TaxID=2899127 RepID=UPI001EE81598
MAKITVVDDVAVNRELLTTILHAQGHCISEADNGATALQVVRDERPDLIICDILMPDVDGFEFVRRLRTEANVAHIPVIFCTAHFLEPEARQLADVCGVSKVLIKPIDPQELIRVVTAIIEEGPQEAPQAPLPGRDFDRQHLHLVSSKLSEKVDELQIAHDRLAALVELNLQLASEHDRTRLLAHACSGARALTGAEYCTIAVQQSHDMPVHISHSGIDPDVLATIDPVSVDHGELGRVYRDDQVLKTRVAQGQDFDSGLPAGYPALRELLAASVKSPSARYGWVVLSNSQDRGGFAQADVELIKILGAQTGRMYENGCLFTRMQQYADELQAGIIERERARQSLAAQCEVARILNQTTRLEDAAPRILRAICIELGFSAATLWSVDLRDHVLKCVDVHCESDEQCGDFVAQSRAMTLAPGMGFPGTAWASGSPHWSQDLEASTGFVRGQAARDADLVSGGAVPIMVGGAVIGVLDVFSRDHLELDVRLADTLVTLGTQIGQFFERTTQHRRILRLTRVYAVLSGINSAIVRIHDRAQLFKEACRISVNEGQFGIAWIGDVDQATGEVIPVAWAGVDDAIGADRLSFRHDVAAGQGAVGEALRTGQPCFIDDLIAHQPVGKRREEALRRGYQSLVALPLVVGEKVVGVMVLYAHERAFFTDEERALLEELSNDVSFALEYIGKQNLISYLAYYDALTGLPNRAHLTDRLGVALQAVRHHPDERIAVVLWDLNRFSRINDTFGRQVGDNVLREMARRLAQAWPDRSDVARITSDQFAAVISGRHELGDIARLIEGTASDVLAPPMAVGGHELRIDASAGIAVSNGIADADVLIRNAEAALRKAKRSGARYLFYDPEMNALIAGTLMLENKLRLALERDEFVLHYQPKINSMTGRVTGLEALIRWHDPENGMVPPGSFIPLLEETGMIIQVGTWVIHQALADARRWQAEGVRPPRIAVNVSPLQLQQTDFVDRVEHALSAAGREHPGLDLEITESLIMTDMEGTIRKLSDIQRMGVEIAIDDFGTGYSSFGYLARLPI